MRETLVNAIFRIHKMKRQAGSLKPASWGDQKIEIENKKNKKPLA